MMDDKKELMIGNVRELWPRLRPCLEQIRTEQQPDWIPEDIYHWVLAGKSHLYVTSDGFVVAERCQNPITNEIFISILVAYAWSKDHNVKNYLPAFESLAREVGAKYIELCSNHKGLQRMGFKQEFITYRRRL